LNINKARAKKSLGQNFIIDDNFLLKMSSHIDSSRNNIVIEIGPGKGALTKYLIKTNFKKLLLIEKDNNLASQLKLKYKTIKNVFVINDDALTFDYSIFKNTKEKVTIYGNLPFNISTKLPY
jgi:Dimethyladenosine transferase (rRNA methylation)